MTTTAERAKDVLAFLAAGCGFDACVHPDCPSCGCMAYLTAAITAAENEKLEEAAAAVVKSIGEGPLPDIIRALKKD